MAANTYALVRIPIVTRNCGYYLRWWYNGWHYWQFIQGGLSLTTEGQKYYTTGTRSITMNSGPLDVSQIEGLRTILNTTEIYLWTDAGWMVIRIEAGSVKIYDNKFGGHDLTLTAIIGSRLPSITGFSPVTPIPVVPADGNFCETIIGNQIWMCKAWDGNFPGSKVYDNNEDNRTLFGGLYKWDQINSPGFVPNGWRVPTLGDWLVLFAYINSQLQWHLPSYDELQLMYDNLHASALGGFASDLYWSSTEESLGGGYALDFSSNTFGGWNKDSLYHVRACRIFTATAGMYSIGDTGPQGGLIFYATGTSYGECAASDQSTSQSWSNVIDTESEAGGTVFGTGSINTTLIIAQLGHIDSAALVCRDYQSLTDLQAAGGLLKETGFDYWNSPNQDAVDSVDFGARSTGELVNNTLFSGIFQTGTFWSTEESDADQPPTMGIAIQFSWQYGSVTLVDLLKTTFAGVRLIKIGGYVPIRQLLLGYGGGIDPYSGTYISYDDGLTWTADKVFSEGVFPLPSTDWFPYQALFFNGDVWICGQGIGTGDAYVYNLTQDTLYQFNIGAGPAYCMVVDQTTGKLVIGAFYGATDGRLFEYNEGTDSFDDMNAIEMEDHAPVFLTHSGTYLICVTVGGIFAISHGTPLRQSGAFNCGLDLENGTMFAGEDNGHVFKSTDYGLTWSDLGDKTSGDGVLTMGLVGSGRIVFMGYNDVYYTDDEFATVHKTYDGGDYGPILKVTETICIIPNVTGVSIPPDSYTAVLRSIDNGLTWTPVAISIENGFQGFAFAALTIPLI